MTHAGDLPYPELSARTVPAGEAERLCQEWFEAYGAAVYGYFRFHVSLPEAAEDLTAETFLKVVRFADRFDRAKGHPNAWIFTIARNVLRDWRRRARLRRHVPVGGMYDLVQDAPSPEERLLREEEVGRLLDAVSALGPADRNLIGLRYGSGLEHEDIARTLGVSVGTVRTRLWRALGRLRRLLPHEP